MDLQNDWYGKFVFINTCKYVYFTEKNVNSKFKNITTKIHQNKHLYIK